MKMQGSTLYCVGNCITRSTGEVSGTTSVEVKFVDICRNADGEASLLDG